ncbi:MAG: hypothetical protein JNG90_17845 [Planctomycetaceae bacterium]|nr:hypothetical protein [Planctomycetaceae bacterium]
MTHTKYCLTVVIAAAVLTAGRAEFRAIAQEAPEKNQETPAKSDRPAPGISSMAVGVLRVSAPPETGLASPFLIDALLHHPNLRLAVMMKVGIPVGDSALAPSFDVTDQGPMLSQDRLPVGICELLITARSYDPKVPAQKLLDSVVAPLFGELNEMNQGGDRNRLRQAELEARAKQSALELAEMHRHYQLLERDSGSWPAAVQERVQAEIASQMITANVTETALTARVEALERRIAEVGKAAQEASVRDPVGEQLARVLQILKEKLRVAQQAERDRTGTRAAVLEVETDVAAAEAELTRHQKSLQSAAGGERLLGLQHQLDAATIELKEVATRREALAKQADKLRRNPQLDLAQIKIDAEEARYRMLLKALDETRLRSSLQQMIDVRVIPLGSPQP